jgi:hypothetical protein
LESSSSITPARPLRLGPIAGHESMTTSIDNDVRQ